MTKDQEQLVTMLFIKYGSLEGVVDTWVNHDAEMSLDEQAAFNAWLNRENTNGNEDPQTAVLNLTLEQNDSGHRYVTAEIDLDISDKD